MIHIAEGNPETRLAALEQRYDVTEQLAALLDALQHEVQGFNRQHHGLAIEVGNLKAGLSDELRRLHDECSNLAGHIGRHNERLEKLEARRTTRLQGGQE